MMEESNVFFSGIECSPSGSWVGKGAWDVVLNALAAREKREGSDVFFSGIKGDSSTSSGGEGARDVIWSALDIS